MSSAMETRILARHLGAENARITADGGGTRITPDLSLDADCADHDSLAGRGLYGSRRSHGRGLRGSRSSYGTARIAKICHGRPIALIGGLATGHANLTDEHSRDLSHVTSAIRVIRVPLSSPIRVNRVPLSSPIRAIRVPSSSPTRAIRVPSALRAARCASRQIRDPSPRQNPRVDDDQRRSVRPEDPRISPGQSLELPR